jgi:molybdate/tungstate transport system substrate-binding protein
MKGVDEMNLRNRGVRRFGLFSAVIIVMFCLPAIAGPAGKLIIFNAGSLTVPLAQMEKEFEAKTPGVDIQREAGGSTKLARMIAQLGKPADIMASADYEVIDKTLMPKDASWNVRFASNQLVLCYTDKSKFADTVNSENWYEILERKGVSWGHSDANLDPCGYRALMVLQLAEIYYKKPDLYKRLLANRPVGNIRPKSVELVSLLQTGNMDFAWEYLSVAVQHKLKYLKLPNEINLGDYRLDDYYKQAKVEVTGDKPGKTVTRVGSSCTYGLTVVKSAPNPELAVAFLRYMLSPEGGLKILQESGQPPFIPCWVPTKEMKESLPADLRDLIEVKEMK